MIYAVIVSALLTQNHQSPTIQVMEAMFANKIIPLYNEEIISEYEEVLQKHFPRKPIVVTPAEMIEILRAKNL